MGNQILYHILVPCIIYFATLRKLRNLDPVNNRRTPGHGTEYVQLLQRLVIQDEWSTKGGKSRGGIFVRRWKISCGIISSRPRRCDSAERILYALQNLSSLIYRTFKTETDGSWNVCFENWNREPEVYEWKWPCLQQCLKRTWNDLMTYQCPFRPCMRNRELLPFILSVYIRWWTLSQQESIIESESGTQSASWKLPKKNIQVEP